MQSRGEDCPTKNDIDEFGLYYACQRTKGNFSLFINGECAARGRVGTSPLYWNRPLGLFSFNPGIDLEHFPPGHLYDSLSDRLVCWDPLYYDAPMSTLKCASNDIDILLINAVKSFRADAYISFYKSGILEKYIDVPLFDVTCDHHKRIITDLGCAELFDDTTDFRPDVNMIVNKFEKIGVQIWSPFFNSDVMEYVLDCTFPEDRPRILKKIIAQTKE